MTSNEAKALRKESKNIIISRAEYTVLSVWYWKWYLKNKEKK